MLFGLGKCYFCIITRIVVRKDDHASIILSVKCNMIIVNIDPIQQMIYDLIISYDGITLQLLVLPYTNKITTETIHMDLFFIKIETARTSYASVRGSNSINHTVHGQSKPFQKN